MDPHHCSLPRCLDSSGGLHPEPDLEGRGGDAGAAGQAQGDWVRLTTVANSAMPFIRFPDRHPYDFGPPRSASGSFSHKYGSGS
jgi:hypothetical protein